MILDIIKGILTIVSTLLFILLVVASVEILFTPFSRGGSAPMMSDFIIELWKKVL